MGNFKKYFCFLLPGIFLFNYIIYAQQTQYRRGTDLQKDYQTYEQKYRGKNLLEEKRRLYPLDKVTSGTGVWTELNPKVPRVDYLGIHFVNTDTGWACGDLGTVIKSTDGGESWITEETNTTLLILKVDSYNGQVVIATGYDGLILRSSDGGETFEQVSSGVGSGIDLWGLQMVNDTLGWVSGMNQILLKTTDGGLGWQQIIPGLNAHYWSLDFLNGQYGMIACGGGKILKTTDGGSTWIQLQAGDTRALYTVDIIDSLHIAAAGETGKMIYSEDGGLNWTEHNNLGFYPEINCISFVNRDTGYVVGDEYGLRKTTNRGYSWFTQGFNDIGEYQIDLHSDGYGFAAGTSLKLDRTINGYDNWQRLIINDNFVDVSFVNDQLGYIVGTTYTGWPFFKTTDGGESWITVPNYPDSIMGNLTTVKFLDSLHGFLCGATLIYTTDGGESWQQANGITNSISKLFFINNQTGWAVGGPRIFKTTDGGVNWVEQLYDIVANFRSIFFSDSSNGWAVSPNYNGIYNTTDGGENWIERVDLPSYIFANDIYFNDSTGFVTNLLELEKTTNAGNNWFTQFTSQYIIRTFGWLTQSHGFIMGDGVYETVDTGNAWNEILDLRNIGLRKLQAPTEYLGYSTGYLGLIYKYKDTTYIPVELSSFSANATAQNVLLNWSTATETNNRGFEIERQVSTKKNKVGGRWETIGFVDGYGTTTLTHSYSYTDENVLPGKYYYRLKQIDFDGSFEYSKEIEVEVTPPTKFSLEQNYPNPFNPTTTIKYTIPNVGTSFMKFIKLKVYNTLGEEVATLVNEEKPAGSYTVKFNGSNLPSGVYIYRLTVGSYSAAKKLILLK
jgi:photosystem II stability/assembly factor-like uncharacterized protein